MQPAVALPEPALRSPLGGDATTAPTATGPISDGVEPPANPREVRMADLIWRGVQLYERDGIFVGFLAGTNIKVTVVTLLGYQAKIGESDNWSLSRTSVTDALDLALTNTIRAREAELDTLKALQARDPEATGERS
jgi:hypothetical protein